MDEKLLTIKEIEKRTGLPRSTIYHYEENGLIQIGRNANGYRQFTDKDVDILICIKRLRQLDMPLERIKFVLMHPDGDLHEAVTEQLVELYTLRRHIDNLIEFAEKIEDLGALPFILGKTEAESVDELIDQLHEITESAEYRQIQKNFTLERAEVLISFCEQFGKQLDHDPDDEAIQVLTDAMCRYISDKIIKLEPARFPTLPLAFLGEGTYAEKLDESFGEGTAKLMGMAMLHYYANHGAAIWGDTPSLQQPSGDQ